MDLVSPQGQPVLQTVVFSTFRPVSRYTQDGAFLDYSDQKANPLLAPAGWLIVVIPLEALQPSAGEEEVWEGKDGVVSPSRDLDLS